MDRKALFTKDYWICEYEALSLRTFQIIIEITMRYSGFVKKAVSAGCLALLFSFGASEAGATGWHNPRTEKPKGPFGTFWTLDRGNIDFGTNAPEIKVRYVLEGRNIPKGATEMASLGVDLYDIDNDGIFHLLDGKSNLGKAAGDTVTFSFSVNYGNSAKNGNEFRLYLPLYNEVKWLEIGTDGGTYFHFEPVPVEKTIAFYNVPVESVARPSQAVRNVVQRKADFPVKVVSKKESKKAGYLLAVDGAKADTTGTVEAVFNVLGTTTDIPDILKPVRQRRDYTFYDWTERHSRVLYRERRIAPNPEIVMIGNSITHYWSGEPSHKTWHSGVDSWNDIFADRNVINCGYGWDRLGNMMWRMMHEELDGFNAKHIFVMAGTNDIYSRSEETIAEGMLKLIEYVRVKQPQARIHIVHIYPRRKAIGRVDKVNATVDELLKSSSLTNYDIVDVKSVLTKADGSLDESLFRDGLHPNEEGYRRIAEVYRKYIQN